MAILIDLLLLLILVICILIGVKRGFFRSIMTLVTFAAALFCSIRFSPLLADYLQNVFFFEKIRGYVGSALRKIIGNGGGIDLSTLFSDKPDPFLQFVERFGLKMEELESQYSQSLSQALSPDEAIEKLTDYIAGPLSSGIAKVCAFAMIFIGVVLILLLAALLLDLIFKIPVLKTANRIAGGIFGAFCGLLYAWILCLILSSLIPHIAMIYPKIIAPDLLDHTILYQTLSQINLIGLLSLALFH